MINKIHILGASGSGTTTLGIELAKVIGYKHFDCDDFLWEDTTPPYQQKRSIDMRQKMLQKVLENNSKWILTGSMVGWGDSFIAYFDLVVYLWIPQDIRIARLKEREKRKHGTQINEGGEMYKTHLDFIDWASKYDLADETIRSKKLHELWLQNISCEIFKIEGPYELKDKVELVKDLVLNS